MELTGKAKERFEKWIVEQQSKSAKGKMFEFWIHPDEDTGVVYNQRRFTSYPDSMKFSVYVDFLDSEGIYIEIETHKDYGMKKMHWSWNIEQDYYGVLFNTRHEARTKAIEKANELLNQKLEQ